MSRTEDCLDLKEGAVILRMPKRLSQESHDLWIEWLGLIAEKVKRDGVIQARQETG